MAILLYTYLMSVLLTSIVNCEMLTVNYLGMAKLNHKFNNPVIYINSVVL